MQLTIQHHKPKKLKLDKSKLLVYNKLTIDERINLKSWELVQNDFYYFLKTCGVLNNPYNNSYYIESCKRLNF